MEMLARVGRWTLARCRSDCQPRGSLEVDYPWRVRPGCRYCGRPGQGRLSLCADCEGDLPWIETSCVSCALPLPAGTERCGACLRREPKWNGCAAAVRYAYPADWLVRRLKFGGEIAMARLMAGIMAPRAPDFLARRPVLAPVPLHWRRRLGRGFDQAAELAVMLARQTGLAVRPRLLARQRATSAQVDLDALARRRNLAGAFRVRATDQRRDDAVCLVDDVMTTGATMAAATAALRSAGFSEIYVWCFARAEH